MDKLQDEILNLAIQRGLVTRDELQKLNTANPLGELMEQGRLSQSMVEALKRELLEQMNTLTSPADVLPKPAAVEKDDSDVSISAFGRYVQLRLIGQGGMARVYRAYDPSLRRTVALKLLHSQFERLLLEARSQARVEHENVCKVYEVGDVEGQPYICMQYVQGRTLADAMRDLNQKQKVEIVRKIADAVDAAHIQGLVHRDIKPSNIMLEKTEGDHWKPYIMDFGLARIQEAPGITQTGVLVGTPLYMAPEQARGAQTDERSDVYSLGATLYELIAGRPPFIGSSAELILKVLHEDPPVLHKTVSGLSLDLETIVMKCLEKEPNARYESAKALSEDLKRYLEGEPITARPVSWSHRVWKKAKKNRVTTAILTSGFVITTVLLLLLVLAQWKGKVQAKYESEFGNEIRYLDAMLLSTYTAPLHDVRPELKRARKRLQQLEQRMRDGGRWAYAPGNNALGQGYLLLKEFKKAENFLQNAWESGYKGPSTAYALGKVQGILWRQALVDSDRLTSVSMQEDIRREAEKRYLLPAIQYLSQASKHVESPAYVEALIALYGKRYDVAFAKSRQALERSSRPYEVLKLQGDIHFALGRDKSERGDTDGALQSFASAGKAYNRAAEIARSDQDIYLGDAERRIRTMYVLTGQPSNSPEGAIEACDKAIRVQPDHERAHLYKADAYLQQGISQLYSSGDPLPALRKSIEMAREAARLNPTWPEPHQRIGSALLRICEYETANGIDPRETLQNAMSEIQIALKLDPQFADAYLDLAAAYFYRGEYELLHGGNPLPSLQKMIEILEKNLQFLRRDTFAYNLLGLAYLDVGEYRLKHGEDPRPDLKKAIESYAGGLKINPSYSTIYLNLSVAHQDIARYEMNHGIDPGNTLEQAIVSIDQSLRLSSNFAFAHYNRGTILLQKAEHKLQIGEDPRPDLNEAMKSFQKATQINPDLTRPALSLGEAHLLLAKYVFAVDNDPTPDLEKSRLMLQRYLKNDVTDFVAYSIRGEVELLAGRWAMKKRRPAQPYFDRAVSEIQKAIALNKDEISLFRKLAAIFRWQAESLQQRKQSAEPSIVSGMQVLESAAELNPRDTESLALRGTLTYLRSREAQDSKARKILAKEASEFLSTALHENRFLKNEYELVQRAAESLLK